LEVRGREERGAVVLDQRLLVGVLGDPEDDDVVVPLAGLGVVRVGPGVAEEDEALAADLVHGVLARALDRDARHRQREVVDLLDGRALRAGHGSTVLRGVLVRPFSRLSGVATPDMRRSTRMSGYSSRDYPRPPWAPWPDSWRRGW